MSLASGQRARPRGFVCGLEHGTAFSFRPAVPFEGLRESVVTTCETNTLLVCVGCGKTSGDSALCAASEGTATATSSGKPPELQKLFSCVVFHNL